MTIQTLIESLRNQNVQLCVDGDRLRCSGPREVLTAEVRAELAKRKAEIISFLQTSPAVTMTPPSPPTSTSSNPYQLPAAKASDVLTPQQRHYLQTFMERYIKRTRKSKQWMQKCRPVLADYDSSAGFRREMKEMHYLPVSDRAQGTRIWDIDGNEYIDFCMGFGVNLFGHVPPFESAAIAEELQRGMALGPHWHLVDQVAELLCEFTGLERVTFVNSGTEAVMAALRIARAVTGRSKIAFFAGSYHGTSDGLLVVRYLRPDGELSALPMVPGVTRHMAEDVLVLDYDNPESLKIIQTHAQELAAVLVEPVQSRKPDLQPKEFLQALRQITADAGIALIFDEMITGFRVHPGGAQAWFGIQADIATYGKIIGGGMPIGVVAGKAKYMDVVDGGMWSYGDASGPHVETTFITGTFSRHPLSMAAVLALLKELKRAGPALQQQLNQRTTNLVQRLNDFFKKSQAPIQVVSFGSLFRFTSSEDLSLFYYHLADKGIYIGVNHNCFLSPVHSDDDLEQLVRAVMDTIGELQRNGFLPCSTSNPIATSALLSIAESAASAEAQTLPLTEIQQDYWLATHLGIETAQATVEGMFLRLKGSLQIEALRRAVQQIVDRHGALRATFAADGTFQRIAPTLVLEVPVIDLSHFNHEERERRVTEWMANQSKVAFDLVQGPLFRCYILKLASREHLLCPIAHHLIMDAWSFEVLFKDLVELYPAECQGRSAQLPSPMQYEAYVRWQEDQRTSQKRAADEAFWTSQFSDAIPVVDLPTDRPRPKVMTYAGAREHKRVNASLMIPLKKWSGQHGATLFMTLLTTFAVFLKHLTGQDDLVIGTPTAIRSLRGSENLIGYCVNIMPIRIQITGDPRFSDLLVAVRRTLLQCYEHVDYPFGTLIRNLNPKRDPGRLPLVAVTFNLDRRVALPSLEDLAFDLVPQPIYSTQYDFLLDVLETEDELLLDCFYKTDLFERGTICCWMENLVCLLQSVITTAEEPVSALEFLPEAERHKLLVAWNETRVDYPCQHFIHELFEVQAARMPEAHALVFGNERLTYRELNERANQLAHYLRAQGVGSEALVGVCVERSTEMVVGLLGILKAGGAYVPLDPTYPPDRLAFMLQDAQVPWLLTQAQLIERLPEYSGHIIRLDADWETVAHASTANPSHDTTGDNLAYVIYTSGSTGKPKGAMNTHAGILNRLLWMQDAYHLTTEDVVLQKTPFSFDVSVWEFFWPLIVGARLVIARPEGHKDPAYLVEAIVKHGVTTLHFVPPMLEAFLSTSKVQRCISLRRVICSGEALPHELQERFFERFADVELHNLYGPTEAAVDVTYWPCCPQPESHNVPIGRPVANTQLYILDAKGQPVPTGMPGELYLGGVQVGRGYYHRPELTAERFVPNPVGNEPGARLYRTGDLARYRSDGNVEFLGRLDYQVKLRGYRIELGEIEAILTQHPAVQKTIVLAKDSEHLSDGKRLVAFIVPAKEPEFSRDDLCNFLKKKLPEYMVPSSFVLVEEIPLSPNGKVDRRALASLEAVPTERAETFVAPRTPTEETIAEIWREVLHVEKVGVYDDFFELGGHSLLGAQVMSRLYNAFQVEIPLGVLFESSTIADLAEAIVQCQLEPLDQDAIAQFLAEIEQISPEQAGMALASTHVQ